MHAFPLQSSAQAALTVAHAEQSRAIEAQSFIQTGFLNANQQMERREAELRLREEKLQRVQDECGQQVSQMQKHAEHAQMKE